MLLWDFKVVIIPVLFIVRTYFLYPFGKSLGNFIAIDAEIFERGERFNGFRNVSYLIIALI
ncbi:MAG: hypothetical protein EU539_13760 [Promethearchaeota archaeon]|nr:MAG: hypothetical protein EU539_13760 [Candidatus Lokiarchaeota archaeon]